jgi:site-specific DNA-methyltransferase (adenine-specific)
MLESRFPSEGCVSVRILEGDCLSVMPTLDANSIDAVVCDPPYGLKFMGREWDHGVPGVPFWEAALRVAKPGAHLVAFGGTRTFHRLTCAIEDAGWEIRDCLMWLYGSGFPKSLDVSKAIDKALGAERTRFTPNQYAARRPNGVRKGTAFADDNYEWQTPVDSSAATDDARQWEGWGTALKPAWEPIILARKPFKGTVASNVLEHSTGSLNVDGCRIEGEAWKAHRATGLASTKFFTDGEAKEIDKAPHALGRWPANVVFDEEAAALLDEQSGDVKAGGSLQGTEPSTPFTNCYGEMKGRRVWESYADAGGASRFFYTAKASRSERNAGLEHHEKRPGGSYDRGFTENVEKIPEYAAIARARIADYAPLFNDPEAA